MSSASVAAGLVMSLALTSGCATYNQSKTVASVGGYTMLAGLPIAIGVGVVVKESSNDGFAGGMWGGAVLLAVLMTGAVVGGSGLIGMGLHDKPRSEAQNRQDAVVRKQDAWALTKTSAAAARRGDCDTVRKLDPQVLAVDATFHATVFLADLGIKRCLVPAPP